MVEREKRPIIFSNICKLQFRQFRNLGYSRCKATTRAILKTSTKAFTTSTVSDSQGGAVYPQSLGPATCGEVLGMVFFSQEPKSKDV